MPFVWVDEPQYPERITIEVPGPLTISYKVDQVANLVNAGGELDYNTPQSIYDIIYQVKSLNASHVRIENADIETLDIRGNANIQTATINTANFINVTSNTIFANVAFGTNNPLSNLELSTKEYVDTTVANVPSGGSDLQNIIDEAGDLLVGIGPNTATRHPIGTTGQILMADSTTDTGLRWRSVVLESATQSFTGLILRNHPNKDLKNTHVILIKANEIVMSSGTRTYGWNNISCNINASGVGGIDNGEKIHSQWYEIHAIHNSTTNEKNLIFHRSQRILREAQFLPTTNMSVPLRRSSDTRGVLAQSFLSSNNGPLTSIELEVSKTGSPSGLVWCTIEANTGNFPSGTTLSISNVILANEISTEKTRIRFIFDDPTNIANNTPYHISIYSDYPLNDTNYLSFWGHETEQYTGGYASQYRTNLSSWSKSEDLLGPHSFWFKVFVEEHTKLPVVPPPPYDEFCMLGYTFVNENGILKRSIQHDRRMVFATHSDWVSHITETDRIEVADMRSTVPPQRGIATYYIYRAPGTPALPVFIGKLTATDIPFEDLTGRGYLIANTYGIGAGSSPGERVEFIPPIALEHQAMNMRTGGPNCKAYLVSYEF